MAKFRGITWNNSRFGAKIIVRRSIDIAEMGDFGSITSDADDLPTRGAVHRVDKSGSTSGTRNYLDLRGIAGQYSNVVDTQDMGLISETTSTHRVWSSTGAISDISSTAPTTLDNPSGSSSTTTSYTLSGSTASGSSTVLASTFNSQINSIYVYNDGQNAIVTGRNATGANNYGMVEIEMSTAYDISTASATTNDFWWRQAGHYGSTEPIATVNDGFQIDGFSFNDDGTRMYIGGTNGYIYQYILTTAYNIDGHILKVQVEMLITVE